MSGDRGVVPIVGESAEDSGRSRKPPEGDGAVTVAEDDMPPLSRRTCGAFFRLGPTPAPPEEEFDKPRR